MLENRDDVVKEKRENRCTYVRSKEKSDESMENIVVVLLVPLSSKTVEKRMSLYKAATIEEVILLIS